MLPSYIDSALIIASSMALYRAGHPGALAEVQRQMRLINEAYSHPSVLRATDEVVRATAVLHGPPNGDGEDARRERVLTAIDRLRRRLDDMPEPLRLTLRKKAPAR